MPTKLFASMGFTICALFFLVLVFIMYMSKKKIRAFDNRVFLVMLILTFFFSVNELAYIYSMYGELDGGFKFFSVVPLCYSYVFFGIAWFICLVFYIWSKTTKISNNTNRERKLVIAGLVLLAAGMFLVSCILPIDYPVSNSNLYVFAGPAVYVLYIIAIITLLFVCVVMIIRKNKIPKYQRYPIYLCLLILIVVNALQMIFDYDYNSLSFLCSFVITTLYFTIESQDYRLIAELEQKQEEAEMADKAKTRFLSNMSHEIRTPLNTILGVCDILLSNEKIVEEELKNNEGMVLSACDDLSKTINNILDISSIEAGKLVVDQKEYKTQDLVYSVNQAVSSKIVHEVDFNIETNPNLADEYYGDCNKISRILVGILNSVIENTEYGKIGLKIDSTVISKEEQELIFTIFSSYNKMSNSDFEKLFNSFETIDADPQKNVTKINLELVVAKDFLDLLKGSFEFAEEEENGSKYIIKIVQGIVGSKENK